MAQRLSARHRYQEILTLFQRWPGVGSLSAKRWFRTGVSQRQFALQLKRLSTLFESLSSCPCCGIPKMTTEICFNCQEQQNYKAIALLGDPSDAFVIETFACLRDHYFMALPAYLSYQGQFEAADKQIGQIARLMSRCSFQHCLVLFNQSLEARSTLWLLKKQCPQETVWKDASFMSQDKDSLGAFSDHELKLYEQQLENYLAQT